MRRSSPATGKRVVVTLVADSVTIGHEGPHEAERAWAAKSVSGQGASRRTDGVLACSLHCGVDMPWPRS
jgi:hypothetical protein